MDPRSFVVGDRVSEGGVDQREQRFIDLRMVKKNTVGSVKCRADGFSWHLRPRAAM